MAVVVDTGGVAACSAVSPSTKTDSAIVIPDNFGRLFSVRLKAYDFFVVNHTRASIFFTTKMCSIYENSKV